MISVEEFDKVDIRAGTVLEVKDNKKSRNPAYVISIDFGEELGIKKSSAQITTLYKTGGSDRQTGNLLCQPHSYAHRQR